MKTELLHSYSSTSLSGLSRSPSTNSILALGNKSPRAVGGDINNKDGKNNTYTTLEDYAIQDKFVDQEGDQDGCCVGWLKSTFTKKNITKKFPVISWLPTYNVSKLVSDFIAGLTVGLV